VIQIVFFASLFTFPLFSIWLVGSRQLQSLKPANPWAVGFRSVAMAINILAAFYAFQVLPMGQAYALLFTAPLIVTALSGPILRERVDGASWVAVALGFVGVIVVLQPKAQGISLGHIAALTAALVSAMNSVLVRKLGTSERSVVLLLYPMMTTLLAMALLLPMVYRPMALGDLGITAAIAVMSITAGVLTIQAYRRGRAAIIAPMQ
jgi:drug/metabolite transporter (DMT)-like permease